MNVNIVYFDFSTILSMVVKLSVMLPQMYAKAGMATPIAMAAIEPIIMRM